MDAILIISSFSFNNPLIRPYFLGRGGIGITNKLTKNSDPRRSRRAPPSDLWWSGRRQKWWYPSFSHCVALLKGLHNSILRSGTSFLCPSWDCIYATVVSTNKKGVTYIMTWKYILYYYIHIYVYIIYTLYILAELKHMLSDWKQTQPSALFHSFFNVVSLSQVLSFFRSEAKTLDWLLIQNFQRNNKCIQSNKRSARW